MKKIDNEKILDEMSKSIFNAFYSYINKKENLLPLADVLMNYIWQAAARVTESKADAKAIVIHLLKATMEESEGRCTGCGKLMEEEEENKEGKK